MLKYIILKHCKSVLRNI